MEDPPRVTRDARKHIAGRWEEDLNARHEAREEGIVEDKESIYINIRVRIRVTRARVLHEKENYFKKSLL